MSDIDHEEVSEIIGSLQERQINLEKEIELLKAENARYVKALKKIKAVNDKPWDGSDSIAIYVTEALAQDNKNEN